MIKFFKKQRQTKDAKRIGELESEVELLTRQLRISTEENATLCLVIVRDRERVQAELNTFTKQTAANEI